MPNSPYEDGEKPDRVQGDLQGPGDPPPEHAWYVVAVRVPLASGVVARAVAVVVVGPNEVSLPAIRACAAASGAMALEVLEEVLAISPAPRSVTLASALTPLPGPARLALQDWLRQHGLRLVRDDESPRAREAVTCLHGALTHYCAERGPAHDLDGLQSLFDAFRRTAADSCLRAQDCFSGC